MQVLYCTACCTLLITPLHPSPPPPSQITPMRWHVGGTMAAAALSMQYGWAINVGGEVTFEMLIFVPCSPAVPMRKTGTALE